MIRAELHSHTTFSHDGQIRFDSLVKTAQKRSLDIICITDHDTTDGAKEFQREARKRNLPLEIIVGEEHTLDDKSHIIGLFLKENIVSNRFEDVVREIKEQGGIVILPHQFSRKDGFLRVEENIDRAVNSSVDCYEIFNPKCSFQENLIAHTFKTNMRPLGGSDAHYEGELGECIVTFQRTSDESAVENLRNVILGKQRYSVMGIHQTKNDRGRKYASTYYKYKKFVRIPSPFLPLANELYRLYRNTITKIINPILVEKFNNEQKNH